MAERKTICDNFQNLLDPSKDWNIYSQHSLKLAIKFKNDSDSNRPMKEIKREKQIIDPNFKEGKPIKLKSGVETWVIVESLDQSNPKYFIDGEGSTFSFNDTDTAKGTIKNGVFTHGKTSFQPGSSIYTKDTRIVEKMWGKELTKTEHKKSLDLMEKKGRIFPLVLLKQTVDSLFGEKVTQKELDDCVQKGNWAAIEKKHQIVIRFFRTHGMCLGHVVTKEEAGSVLNCAGKFIPGKGICPGNPEIDTPLEENNILAIELDRKTGELQKEREFWIRENISVPFLVRQLTPEYIKLFLLDIEKATKAKITKLIKEVQTRVVEACQDTSKKFVPRGRENVIPTKKKAPLKKKAASKKAPLKKKGVPKKKAASKKAAPKKKASSKKAQPKKKSV
jgi:hypothetical protein